MKIKLIKYKSVKSTNDIAITLIKKRKTRPTLISSTRQTKGRGTMGKKWISQKGNLFISIFFPIDEKTPSFKEFSIVNPIIMLDIVKNYCDEKKLRLKFPNDIMYDGKKICGFLQELIIQNKRKFLIIGIGLNIVSNPNINNGYKATNIYLETNIRNILNKQVHLWNKKQLKENNVFKKLKKRP